MEHGLHVAVYVSRMREAEEERDMSEEARCYLLAERTSLERMLASLPESSVIDRMSLEARKEEVEEELATMNDE